jgi:hypothetical protein
MLPPLFSDHGDPLDVGEVGDAKLEVLPSPADFPTVEVGHIEHYPQLSVLPDKSLELGYKEFLIRLRQFAADVYGELLAVVFPIEFYSHFEPLL